MDIFMACSFMGVPKLIHQTWRDNELPYFPARCVATIKETNPEWAHHLYTDVEMELFFEKCDFFPIAAFRKIPSGIERADIFRCAVLYEKGGIYCDIDVEGIRPFSELIECLVQNDFDIDDKEVILTTDHPIHCSRMFGCQVVMNHFIIAKPKALFFLKYLQEMLRKISSETLGGDPVHTTGPLVFNHILQDCGGASQIGVGILPSAWINPLPDMQLDFPEIGVYDRLIRKGVWRERLPSFAVHYWWHNYSDRPSIFDIYGEMLFKK